MPFNGGLYAFVEFDDTYWTYKYWMLISVYCSRRNTLNKSNSLVVMRRSLPVMSLADYDHGIMKLNLLGNQVKSWHQTMTHYLVIFECHLVNGSGCIHKYKY